jgi:hypothetical protein
MKFENTRAPQWILSVACGDGWCVAVGSEKSSTVEEALRLAKVPEEVCCEIRATATVRRFVDGLLNPGVYRAASVLYLAPVDAVLDAQGAQSWIFSLATAGGGIHTKVVGPATAVTVEKVLSLSGCSVDMHRQIRADPTVRRFVDGALEPYGRGELVMLNMAPGAGVMYGAYIGPVHVVL